MVQDLLNIEARAVGQTQYANYLTIHRKGVPGVDDGEPLAYEIRCFPSHDQVHMKWAHEAVMPSCSKGMLVPFKHHKLVPKHSVQQFWQGMEGADAFHHGPAVWQAFSYMTLLPQRQPIMAFILTTAPWGCLWPTH